jgi:hypothetical protein
VLDACTESQIELATQADAPVVLFPYGPKSMLFLVAISLCVGYPEASWFVYPTPYGYPLDYSDGVERTIWLQPGDTLDIE